MARSASRISNVVMPGPLAPFAECYRLELLARGYTAHSAVNESRQVACLSRWLEDRGQDARDVSGELIEEFLAWRRQGGHVRSQSRPGLLCLLEVLRSAGVAAGPAARPVSVTDVLLASFERYLLAGRGLAAGTVAGYLDQARRFLAGLTGGLAEVTPAEVSAAVLRMSASVSVATAQNFVFGLRSFLRFCFLEGLMDTDLSQAALPVTGRRRPSLPRGIAGAGVQAILASCDRRTALGRHCSIVLTADTYISVLPEVARTAAEKVAALILRAGCLVPGTRRRRQRHRRRVKSRRHNRPLSRAHPGRQIGRPARRSRASPR